MCALIVKPRAVVIANASKRMKENYCSDTVFTKLSAIGWYCEKNHSTHYHWQTAVFASSKAFSSAPNLFTHRWLLDEPEQNNAHNIDALVGSLSASFLFWMSKYVSQYIIPSFCAKALLNITHNVNALKSIFFVCFSQEMDFANV